jgi:PPOX class probable FMN-dependent enzyme
MSQTHDITDLDALRAVVGNPHPAIEAKNVDHLDDFARAFIARSPFLVLSTADSEGRVDASPKGDDPGFVLVEDERTIVVPDRPGNKLAYGHQNLLENPRLGLLFMIPDTPETLRINGRGALTADPDLLERLAVRGKPAVLAIRVTVEECFFHCGKAFIRSGLWNSDGWGPRHRVSFGEMFAAREGAGADTATAIDASIDADYRDNL